ncbi:MAG TPA: TadE family protein [Candidatus Limnocylindria bacterium]|nr:TadE family protein [Candidatus Limnocylindria bacterium]
MKRWGDEDQGMATLETTLMVVILVPLLFAILQFGWLTQRWLAQDGVALQAARYAGELGGDRPELRSYVAEHLRLVGIESSRVVIEVEPAYVTWRQPVRVSLRTEERIAVPFVFSTSVTVRSTAVARGEVGR